MQRPSTSALPRESTGSLDLQRLRTSADNLYNAAGALDMNKQLGSHVATVALDIAHSVQLSWERASRQLEPWAQVAVKATQELFDECTKIAKTKPSSRFYRPAAKSDMENALKNHLEGFEALREIFQIKDGLCQLIVEPDACFASSESHRMSLTKYRVSASNCAYDTLKYSLEAAANMCDGLPWPFKALPQTISHLIKHSELALHLEGKFDALFRLVEARTRLLRNVYGSQGALPKELEQHILVFVYDLRRTFIRLRVLRTIHPAKLFPSAERVDRMIKDEEDALQESEKNLSFAIQGLTVRGVERVLRYVSRPESTNPERTLATTSILPLPPRNLHGRDNELDNIIQLILTPDVAPRLAILGPGGIGKTALALFAVHDERVKRRFEKRRFMVECDVCPTPDDVVSRLADMLGLPRAPDRDTPAAVVTELETLPSLVVLDNLESIWLSPNWEIRGGTERLLARLASLEKVTLLVTCHGTVPPEVEVTWQTEILQRLPLSASRQIFSDMVPEHLEPLEAEARDEFLREMDHVPLSVKLAAQLARRHKPSDLLRRWHKEHNQLLRAHGASSGSRKHDVVTSVAFAISALPPPPHNDDPLQLLIICSHLPHGVSDVVLGNTELGRLFTHSVEAALDILEAHALVYREDGRLKVLAQIRHYVLENQTMHDKYRQTLEKVYLKLARSAPHRLIERGVNQPAAAFIRESANVDTMLRRMIEHGDDSVREELFHSVYRVAWYAYWTSPSITLLDAIIPKLSSNSPRAAKCLALRGRIFGLRGDYNRAMKDFEAAEAHYHSIPDEKGVAGCMKHRGDVLMMQGKYDLALGPLTSSHNAFIGWDDEHNRAARSELSLGRLRFEQGLFDNALQHLKSAIRTLDLYRDDLGVAQCKQITGEVYLKMQEYEACEKQLVSALATYRRLKERLGAARCNLLLATKHRLQGLPHQEDVEKAENLIGTAHVEFQELGNQRELAACAMELGMLRYAQKDIEGARAELSTARELYLKLELSQQVSECDSCMLQVNLAT